MLKIENLELSERLDDEALAGVTGGGTQTQAVLRRFASAASRGAKTGKKVPYARYKAGAAFGQMTSASRSKRNSNALVLSAALSGAGGLRNSR